MTFLAVQPSPLSCYFVPLKKTSSVSHSRAPSTYVSPLM